MQQQTAEAIAQLAAAMEEDRSTVSNLSETNSNLVDQVTNMARQMDQKDEETTELRKSIQQSNVTIQSLVQNTTPTPRNPPKSGGQQNNGGNNGRGQGRNQNRGCGQQQRMRIYYCWTCGVNQTHASVNCNNKADGHQDNATLDNQMGDSNRGIAQA
eukprot:12947667-Ditylum_brightwellii.AAC.1